MRRRIRHEEDAGDLNIVPYLDIIMNLVIFMLLSMTGLISFGVVNVSAPSISADNSAQIAAGETKPKLLLTVAISKLGFYIAGTGSVLPGVSQTTGKSNQTPTVPLKGGKHDFDELTQQMIKVKVSFPTETNIILSADGDISYELLIQTMDACREAKVKLPDGSIDRKPLFFDVSLSTIG